LYVARVDLLARDTVGVASVASTTAQFLLVAILLGLDILVCGGVHAARGFLEGLAASGHL
jgi:hypothetical protein